MKEATSHMINKKRGGAGRLACLALGAAVALPLTACDTDALLEVPEPTFATPASLRTLEGLPILYAGAIGDFQIAYSGSGGDAFLTVSSLFSDELHTSDTFTTRQATDQRQQQPVLEGNTSDAGYNRLQYARRSAAEIAEVIAEIAPNGKADPRFSVVKSLEGFAIIALAEGWCGAVPLGTARGGAPDVLGTPLNTQALFGEAVNRFNEALAANATSHLAAVGKARALLNNGDAAGAAAAVASVPTTFIHFIEHSSNSARQHNPLFSLQGNRRYSVSDREGGTGMPFRSANDPRTPFVQDPANGFDNAVPLFVSRRYPNFGSNVVLADGIEARLIEAEAALRANNTTLWLSKLNELRASVRPLMTARYDNYAANVPAPGTLEPLTDPGSEAARVDLLFRERAFWLYLTGHRHGDLRRLVRQYNRNQATVFPTGPHHRGGNYGAEVTFPVPFNEQQNTNFEHSMCVTTQA
jgi:starch-binding outer membrane protein, SusD/RagB family